MPGARVRHDRRVPPPTETTETCPGCGAVLAPLPGELARHPGASAACRRLFEDTMRGLREDAPADAGAAATVGLADAAYDAQHPPADAPGASLETRRALAGLLRAAAVGDAAAPPPRAWRTTVADVAADLDVIDLHVLVESWARAVHEDWSAPATTRE